MKKALPLLCMIAINTIVFGQTQINWFSDISLCETQDTTMTIPTSYDNYSLNWFLDGDSLTTNNNIPINSSGLYSLYLYGSDTLFDEFNAIVDVENPEFMLTLTDSEVNIDSLVNICIEDSPTLITSQEAYTHFWYLDDFPIGADSLSDRTLSIEDILDEIEFNHEHEYYVEIENACGIYQSKNTVTMKVNECHCSLDMPNVFSPNNDLENDIFKPLNNHELETDAERICESTDFKMEVFNQWGKHMSTIKFENEYPSWGGLDKGGSEAPEGVYFYRIVYQVNVFTLPEEKEITGFFHLYR